MRANSSSGSSNCCNLQLQASLTACTFLPTQLTNIEMLPSSKGTQYVLGMLGRTPEDALCLEDLNATVAISLKAVVRGHRPFLAMAFASWCCVLTHTHHFYAHTTLRRSNTALACSHWGA